jgi:hypothetical protein
VRPKVPVKEFETDVGREVVSVNGMDVMMVIPLGPLKVPEKALVRDVGMAEVSGIVMDVMMVSPLGPLKVPMKVLVTGDESESQ